MNTSVCIGFNSSSFKIVITIHSSILSAITDHIHSIASIKLLAAGEIAGHLHVRAIPNNSILSKSTQIISKSTPLTKTSITAAVQIYNLLIVIEIRIPIL